MGEDSGVLNSAQGPYTLGVTHQDYPLDQNMVFE